MTSWAPARGGRFCRRRRTRRRARAAVPRIARRRRGPWRPSSPTPCPPTARRGGGCTTPAPAASASAAPSGAASARRSGGPGAGGPMAGTPRRAGGVQPDSPGLRRRMVAGARRTARHTSPHGGVLQLSAAALHPAASRPLPPVRPHSGSAGRVAAPPADGSDADPISSVIWMRR